MLLSAGAPAFAQDAAPAQTDVARPSGALGNEIREALCLIIESAAKANDRRLEFFARVTWRESRFQSDAVGPVTRNGQRAQGIAQLILSSEVAARGCDPAGFVADGLSGQALRRTAPPAANQFMATFKLSWYIGEGSLGRRNSSLDPADCHCPFFRILFAAKSMNFKASEVRHHMLEAKMSEPAKLKQFVQREINPKPTLGRCSFFQARAVSLAPARIANRIPENPKTGLVGVATRCT
jgi:hypothetical protein